MVGYDNPPGYRSYLLRCWQERSGHPERPSVWRFSLHDPHNQADAGFATFDDMVAALRRELATGDDAQYVLTVVAPENGA